MSVKLFFEQVGQGPDLVLLHGWGVHGGIFDSVCAQLSQHFRITNIDLPGFGRSPMANEDYSLSLLTQQILDVAPPKAHYLGWSLGGLLATSIALNHPERVDRLITVASSPHFLVKDDWPFAMKASVLENFVSLLEEDYEATLIRFLAIQTMGSETQKQDIQKLKETVFIHGRPAKKALQGGLNILYDTDLREALAQLQVPLLRIYGRLDSLVPIGAAHEIQKIVPDSESFVFRKASHGPFLSHNQEFCDLVKRFLNNASLTQSESLVNG